jgi:ABC-type amino acid transport substrate-binding protein
VVRQRRLHFPALLSAIGAGLRSAPVWIASLGLLCLLGLIGSSQAEEQAVLRVCLLEDNLPYSSRQNEAGFDFDTAKAVTDALGRSFVPVWIKNHTQIIEIEESDFPLRRLSRNECDALFSVPGPDAVKDSPQLTIGAPYYGAAFELIKRDGSTLASIDAVAEKPVAVQAQTIANFVLSARKAHIRTFLSLETALHGLAKGETEAALLWGPAAGWYLHNHPDLRLTLAAGYEPPTVVRWNEHVATRKSDDTLREAIDASLVQLSTAGALKELMARYGIPFHQPFDSTYNLAEMQKLQ